MQPLRLQMIAFALCMMGAASAQQEGPAKIPPWCRSSPQVEAKHKCTNVIPDAETAYAVGMAILKARYGSSFVDSFMPYEAVERGASWCLRRKQHLAPGELPTFGRGHPSLCLFRDDGRVIEMFIAI